MSGTRPGIRPGTTVNTSEKNQSGNHINNEKNFMDGEYFMRQYAHNLSPIINVEERARRQEEEYKRQFKNNVIEMNNMLTNALNHTVLFFNLEEYKRLVKLDKFLRNKLKMEPKNSYNYPPSLIKRLIQRCRGGECETVKVPVPPPKPGHYPNYRKQRKANTRKSNTRKSNTRKSNTRKRSNF